MKRLLSFLIFLVFALNIVGCGFDSFMDGENDHIVQSVDANGASVISIGHDCPNPDNGHHDSDQPCSGDCHHHGHCHCAFLSSKTKLSCPTLDASKGMRVGNFYPDPHPGDLFRPPIV